LANPLAAAVVIVNGIHDTGDQVERMVCQSQELREIAKRFHRPDMLRA